MVAPKTRWVDALGGSVRRQTRENADLKAKLARLRELHRPISNDPTRCNEDGFDWPCPTIRVVNDYPGGGESDG